MLPTTRKDAKILNEKYYFTGKSCPQGHVSKRYSHNGVCYDCVMESNTKWYHKNKMDIEWRKQRLFKCLKNKANKEGVPFELKYDDIIWETHCPVFGMELEYLNLDKPKMNSASFDKIIPEKGYIKNNVRIISYRANWLKQDSTIEQLELIVKYIKENT